MSQTQSTQTNNAQKPQYKLIVQRHTEYKNVKAIGTGAGVKPDEDATISSVRLENDKGESIFNCVCCENGGPSTDIARQDKRIVARDNYTLRWTSTGTNGGTARNYPKWQAKNPQCPIKVQDGTQGANIGIWINCPTFTAFNPRRIIIHSGGCPQHTEGCMLFAYTDNKNGTVSNSAKCVNDFYELALKLGVENITLIVREIEKEKSINYGR